MGEGGTQGQEEQRMGGKGRMKAGAWCRENGGVSWGRERVLRGVGRRFVRSWVSGERMRRRNFLFFYFYFLE